MNILIKEQVDEEELETAFVKLNLFLITDHLHLFQSTQQTLNHWLHTICSYLDQLQLIKTTKTDLYSKR